MAKSWDIVNSSPDILTMFGDNVDMSHACINMYMYKDPMKYTIAVFPYAGVLSSYGLNKMRGKDAVLSYGIAMHLPTETMKLAFLFISLSGIFVFPYAEAKLLSMLIALTYSDTIIPYVYMLSAYGANIFLNRGNVSPYAEMTSQYADVKKMGGRSAKMGNEMTSAHDDVILPSAGVVFPFGVMIGGWVQVIGFIQF